MNTVVHEGFAGMISLSLVVVDVDGEVGRKEEA